MNLSFYNLPLHLRSVALLLILFLLPGPASLSAQDEGLKFIDNTYVDNIKTVRFHLEGVLHSYPLIELDGSGRLRLSFDDFNDEVRRYSYKFIHCNQDWQPSSLSSLEFNAGNTIGYFDDYDFSIRTLRDYIHYELVFPNRDMQISASGNYLLVVYDDEEESFPVITRRFMVQEKMAGVSGRVMRPSIVSQIHTHQEVDLTVGTKQLQVRNPLRELRATVIQNNRWDNAVTDIVPSLLQKEAVRFDYQGQVSFFGGNEYRNLDIRSVRAPRTEMVSVTNEEDGYAMMMEADRPRDNGTYLGYIDFNGDYINDRFEQLNLQLTQESTSGETFDRFNYNYSGDYVRMTFVLATNIKLDRDIYLFGGFTENQLKPEYKMVWNTQISAYVGQTLLKQGFYNYHYVVQQNPPAGSTKASDRFTYDMIEGSFVDTENDYLALIYWRPIGGRYDRLVGTKRMNSNVD
jgi:hypothetical protein